MPKLSVSKENDHCRHGYSCFVKHLNIVSFNPVFNIKTSSTIIWLYLSCGLRLFWWSLDITQHTGQCGPPQERKFTTFIRFFLLLPYCHECDILLSHINTVSWICVVLSNLKFSLQTEQMIPVPGNECWTLVWKINGFERSTWTCQQTTIQ